MSADPSAISAGPEIRVHVRLFAAYREAARTGRLEVPLPAGARVRDLLQSLHGRIPALLAAPGLVAVNQEYVDHDVALHDGEEVALIPPVSGGER